MAGKLYYSNEEISGIVGTKTNMTYNGECLYVGDVVNKISKGRSYGNAFVCYDSENGFFIMGLTSNYFVSDGKLSDGWEFKKVRSYKDLIDGEVINFITFKEDEDLEYCDAVFQGEHEEYKLGLNNSDVEKVIENKQGDHFLLDTAESITFSLHGAVIIRDWLDKVIKEAERLGWKDEEPKKEMTIKEIEEILGYEIKIKE